MTKEACDTIDSLVTSNLKAARILSTHGIDFCSEGKKTLKEACSEAGVSLRRLLREITDAEQYREKNLEDPASINVDELTLYIERYHHHYTTEYITFIKANLSRLVRLHARQFPELVDIKSIFDELSWPLTVHMQHEEFIVFPYIRELAKKGKKAKSSMYRAAYSPISGMLTDHEKDKANLKRLDDLTHHYTPPETEGNAFKITYAAMRALERDLHTHMALEKEVLFPKALEMEIRLSNNLWASTRVQMQ